MAAEYTHGLHRSRALAIDGLPFPQPLLDLVLAEPDRATGEPDRRELALTLPAEDRLGGDAEQVGDLAGGEQPGHFALLNSIPSSSISSTGSTVTSLIPWAALVGLDPLLLPDRGREHLGPLAARLPLGERVRPVIFEVIIAAPSSLGEPFPEQPGDRAPDRGQLRVGRLLVLGEPVADPRQLRSGQAGSGLRLGLRERASEPLGEVADGLGLQEVLRRACCNRGFGLHEFPRRN
jgi:hypothetical protein